MQADVAQILEKTKIEQARLDAQRQAQQAAEREQTIAAFQARETMQARQQTERQAKFDPVASAKARFATNQITLRRSAIEHLVGLKQAAEASAQFDVARSLRIEADSRRKEMAAYRAANPAASAEYERLSSQLGRYSIIGGRVDFSNITTEQLEDRVNALSYCLVTARKPENAALFADFLFYLQGELRPLESELKRRIAAQPTPEQATKAQFEATKSAIFTALPKL